MLLAVRVTIDKNNFKLMYKPNKKPKMSDCFVSVWMFIFNWLCDGIIILVFIFHCVILGLKHFFDISWETWELVKTFFLYGIAAQIAANIICLIVYSVRRIMWSTQVKI